MIEKLFNSPGRAWVLGSLALVAALRGLAQPATPGLPPQNSIVLEIQPTPEFPRNSEGAFVTLKSGRILFAYTQFYGGDRDESAARIVAITSDDAGRTWNTRPRVLVENVGGANVMSVSLLRLQNGRIGMFYIKKHTRIEGHPMAQFSDDEGETWSAPQVIVKAPGYFELNNDRAIQHRNGRLILPIGSYRLRDTDPTTYDSIDFRAITMWYVSDDNGATWHESPQWLASPVPTTREGLQESGVVELADGSLLGWFRTSEGSQFVARSKDIAQTWTLAAPSELKSPTSCAAIKRLPGSATLLAVWNDYSGQFPVPAMQVSPGPLQKRMANRRTPFVLGLSTDGGVTWPRRKLLEGEPDGWYCYAAVHFVGDSVLLAYCAGDQQVGGLNRLRMRRIDLSWLTAP
ncbi:MAG: repeat-like protein [Verrucomicrobia bacterium]|nr:repeat-like protein [Verrucomicrobiota bacterium]